MIEKIKQRLKELSGLEPEKIAEKFVYKVMQKECPDFCRLYKENRTCHNLPPEELNCFGCYCPNYKLEEICDEESGLPKKGVCAVNSKFGFYKRKENHLVLTCINCTVPHRSTYIKELLKYLK